MFSGKMTGKGRVGMEATLLSPGSCGELIQGMIRDQNFLVSCPIDLYSQVNVKLSPFFDGIRVNIPAEKTVKAVQRALDIYQKTDLGAQITIKSQLIRGKGMASSTADLTAAIGAVMIALGREIDLELIKQIALEIEPTDGVFLPGLVVFDHKEGNLATYLGKPPLMDILIFSVRGQIDTIDFNAQPELSSLNRSKESLVEEALRLVKQGIRLNDPKSLGRGATLSSLAHQAILYKPGLNQLLELIKDIDLVYGINIAHSGTLIGILINPKYPAQKLVVNICKNISAISFWKRVSLISGGLKF